jgi:hypothetical protein
MCRVSFGGVAFELGLDSFLQLPGIEWGYDPDTVRAFEQATRLQTPRTSRPEAQQQAAHRYLTTTARREWIRYRCGEIARFHRKLAELVLTVKPDAQVFFSGRLWTERGADTEAAVVDFVRTGGGPAELLAAQGLDFLQAPYATDARVTVLRPLVQLSSDRRLPQASGARRKCSAKNPEWRKPWPLARKKRERNRGTRHQKAAGRVNPTR